MDISENTSMRKENKHKNTKGSEILKSERKSVLCQFQRKESKEPNGMSMEILTALDDFIIDTITNILNKNSGDIPEDLIKDMFI